MFDLTSSKLLILGVFALIVVGPKELPVLLRTIGKYVGMIRRHANEFRAQFEEAMKEAELASIKEDLEKVARETDATLRDAHADVDRNVHEMNRNVDEMNQSIQAPHPAAPESGHAVDPAIADPAAAHQSTVIESSAATEAMTAAATDPDVTGHAAFQNESPASVPLDSGAPHNRDAELAANDGEHATPLAKTGT